MLESSCSLAVQSAYMYDLWHDVAPSGVFHGVDVDARCFEKKNSETSTGVHPQLLRPRLHCSFYKY